MKRAKKIKNFPEINRYKPETAEAVLAAHASFVRDNPAPEWLTNLRRHGAGNFQKQGLPTPELERWKFSNLVPVIKNIPPRMDRADVVYEGSTEFVKTLPSVFGSAPQWLVDVLSAPAAGGDKYHDMALWHMNNAFLRDGLLIDVPDNARGRIEVSINGHDGGFFVPRTVIRLGKNAELTVVEHHKGDGRYWKCRLTQIVVGPGAHFRHIRVQDDTLDAVYTQNTHVVVGRDGTYDGFILKQGCAFSRNQIHAQMTGENGTCHLSGVTLQRGQQAGDNTVLVEHIAPRCRSRQFFRAVMEDQAHGVFQGKIHVHPGAQKTDGYQLSNALLMNEGAEMDTKPELEIYADDVKCSHGATTGQMDDEALFYMRSRGISETAARALLVEGFLGEVVESVLDEKAKNILQDKVRAWLAR